MRKHLLILFIVAVGTGAAASVHAASLRLTPGTGTFTLGGTFDENVMVNTSHVPVNTIEV